MSNYHETTFIDSSESPANTSKLKVVFVTGLLTLLLVLAAYPFYFSTPQDFWKSFNDSLFEKYGRIDISIQKTASSFLNVTCPPPGENNSDPLPLLKCSYPGWLKNKNGQGIVIEPRQSLKYRPHKIELKISGDGVINIEFAGKDKKSETNRYPVYSRYKKIFVNGKELSPNKATTWHNDRYKKSFAVKNGQTLSLEFNVRRTVPIPGIGKLVLFTLLVLSFCIARKVAPWLISQYERGGRDFVFALFFSCLLVIPASRLNYDDISKAENRKLSPEPHLLLTSPDRMNLNYGKQFEKWFNDRFRLRDFSIDSYSAITWNINRFFSLGNAIMDKKTQWMFDKIDKRVKGNNELAKNVAKGINDFGEYLKGKNIKLYVLIVPRKEDIYREDLAFYAYTNDITSINIVDYAKKNANVPILFPYDELKSAAKKDYVFFKNDHHWTDWGAFQGYQMIIAEIRKDFPEIHVAKESDFRITQNNFVRSDWGRGYGLGHTTRRLRLQDHDKADFLTTRYTYYDPKNGVRAKFESRHDLLAQHFENPEIKNIKAITCGTSMNEDFLQFLPQSFSKTLFIRTNGPRDYSTKDQFKIWKNYRKHIEDFSPDLFVICVDAERIWWLADLMKRD